jgi:hypothetical protein
MKILTLVPTLAAAVLGAVAAAPTLAADEDVLGAYFGNTYIWKNQVSNATGRMWLNADGKYFVFFNMGTQAKMPDDHGNGPWQVQGREGTYTLRRGADGMQLCLWPATRRVDIGAAQSGEIYAESKCYDFTPQQVGASWTAKGDAKGRDYKFWLVKGR